MKAIMKKIKPNTCANIMNLIQSILVIKDKREASAIQKLIDENGYAEIYGYCSKDKKSKVFGFADRYSVDFITSDRHRDTGLSGYVVFKFRCYKVEEMVLPYTKFGTGEYVHGEVERKWQTSTMDEDEILKLSCLTEAELYEYLVGKNKGAYAIHISDLEIFNEPKELSEFRKPNTPSYEQTKPFAEMFGEPYTQEEYKKQCERFGFVLTKAPQNFCYIEVE